MSLVLQVHDFKQNPPEPYDEILSRLVSEFNDAYKGREYLNEFIMLEARDDEEHNRLLVYVVPRFR